MKPSVLLFAAAAFAACSLALAQAPDPPHSDASLAAIEQQTGTDVSEQELETFTDIYLELEETLAKFETEMSRVETEEQAQDVHVRLQQESYEKIERHGWTPEKYNTVLQAVNADPLLLQRALELIEERS